MKKTSIIGIFTLGILLGGGVAYAWLSRPPKAPAGTPELEGSIIVSEKYPDGSRRETGIRVPYDVTGTYPSVVLRLSPDRTQVVYSKWENARIILYVADASGANAKRLAEQSVAEGSGGLHVETVRWSEDGKEITYVETPIGCPDGDEDCRVDDFVSKPTTYVVDVLTGAKRIVPSSKPVP